MNIERGSIRRACRLLVSVGVVATAIVVAAPGTAGATCSTSTSLSAIYYYDSSNCVTYLNHINGDTAINHLGNHNMYDNVSSVLVTKATGGGSWRLYLYDQINRTGSYIGLSNGSTTSNKAYNLSSYGLGSGTWNNQPRSLCQIRVVGTSSPC